MPVRLLKRYSYLPAVQILLLALLSWQSVQAASEKPKTSVADLGYGVALYHYYQQDYLPALSELMVANARDGIHGHGDNPLLVDGGISLAFGMPNHAEQIFTRMLQDPQRPQSVRDAAWFYLGKLQYARADWQAAEQSFNKVSAQFNAELLAEMHVLQINLQIKAQQFSGITPKYVEQQTRGSWASLSLYNLFAAHARAGDMPSAQKFLHDLNKLSSDDQQNPTEYIALLDKAYTAMGYFFLQEKNYGQAAQEFKKVSVDGLASNQALLGFGWAAMAQEKYSDAIGAWQVLQSRSLLQAPAQEALVALPFAYEKLNANGDALREYEQAERLLQQELSLIKDMRATLTAPELLALIASEPVADTVTPRDAPNNLLSARIIDDGQNWLKIDSTSIVKTRSVYLRELFSSNQFQTQVLDLRDVIKLQSLLHAWQPKLKEYTELLQQKQILRQQQKQSIVQQTLTQQITQLQQQREQLFARLTAIKTGYNYIALADDQLKATSAKLEGMEAAHQQVRKSGQYSEHDQARLTFLRGIVTWRAAEQFPAALASNEAAIIAIDNTLAGIVNRHENIQQLNATGKDLQPLFTRLQSQQQKLQQQLQQVDSVIASKSAVLIRQVDQQLLAHEQRLNRYLAQSHLAVARLYDTELRKRSP